MKSNWVKVSMTHIDDKLMRQLNHLFKEDGFDIIRPGYYHGLRWIVEYEKQEKKHECEKRFCPCCGCSLIG